MYCYTISSGVPGEEPDARQMLYLCMLSGSLADPVFQNYSAQSKQRSPRMSITQHCRTCAILFSHCPPGPVHTACFLKSTQATLGAKIAQTRLSQWKCYISGCSRRQNHPPQAQEEMTSACHLTETSIHQSWRCQTAQIHVVASCTKVRNYTRQIEHVCIANSMCFMGLISFPFGSS